jgi:ubiquinone/menaquinone biosynthesis C-methylase UbiE
MDRSDVSASEWLIRHFWGRVMTLAGNQNTYENKSIAAWYGKFDVLFPAEKAIFDLVLASKPEVDMVDLGIGGGRTTRHLAQRCKSYIGFDYSAAMVEEARRATGESHTLFQADARDLRFVPDNSADLVLFSFNGIDYVAHEDRLKILREIHRICRPGAFFAFSAHNLGAIKQEFGLKGGRIKGLPRFVMTRIFNFPLSIRAKGDYALLNDGAHRFKLRTYYVRVKEQIRQLADANFHSIRLFGFYSGQEMDGEAIQEVFPYYLAIAS